MAKKANKCPRCGEPFPCDCQEKDSMDIYTAYRLMVVLKLLISRQHLNQNKKNG